MPETLQPIAPPLNLPTRADVTLAFDNATPFQTAWQGVSANYAPLPGYGLTAQQASDDYARIVTSGVKLLSVWYDMGWAYTAGYPTGSPDWTSANMQWFYTFLAAMQAGGVKVMIKMGWHFPQNVGAESLAAPITPSPANEATFAAWVSESLNQFMNVRNFGSAIQGCFFFTEPNTSPLGTVPGGYTGISDYYAHIVTVVRDKIVADDAGRTPIRPRVQLAGPSEDGDSSFPLTQYLKTNIPGVLDAYAFHSYRNTPGFAPLGLTAVDTYAAWNAFFASAVAAVSPQVLHADEVGFLVGGDSDSTGYRATADDGWQWIRLVDGHMQAGCASSFIWMITDSPILSNPASPTVIRYGAAGYIKEGTTVKPAWYAISMHANLTGGGGGTKLYRNTSGGTATLHGTGVWIPQGVKNAVDARGEWTFVVINESTALDAQLRLSANIGGRTVYRYTYSGEIPPAAAGNPAYLLAPDQQYGGVTALIPASRIPGHSVVIFSTILLGSTPPTNLALTATASSDSTGFGIPYNPTLGNASNVINAVNSWRKANDSSHWLRLDWPSAVTIGRLQLAFVATTVGAVYATYTDTTTPAPLADYTIEYWNGSTWVQVVSVTGNGLPNREHIFGQVSTTAIRLNATSAAATACVNNIGVFA